MAFALQKHNIFHRISQTPRDFKKSVYLDTQTTSSFIREKQPYQTEKDTSSSRILPKDTSSPFIWDSKIYALKKRLLAPSWWIEGILLNLGTKEPWFKSLISKRVGKIIASPSNLTAKNVILMFAIWHEILSKIYLSKDEDNFFEFQINKYLSGTQKELKETCQQIENVLATPFQLFEIKASKNSKSLGLSRIGSLAFIKQAQIEMRHDGHICLSVYFLDSLKNNFYLPQELHPEPLPLKPYFVSINPVVIQSMGSRASLKKILHYLFLEFSKQEDIENQINNWSAFAIESKYIGSFHKTLLTNAPSLYDHGVLGWNVTAPNIKLSELKQKISSKCPQHGVLSSNSIIYCWQVSDQAKEAVELEQTLSEKLAYLKNNPPSCLSSTPLSFDQQYVPQKKGLSNKGALFLEPSSHQFKKVRKEKAFKAEKIEKKLLQDHEAQFTTLFDHDSKNSPKKHVQDKTTSVVTTSVTRRPAVEPQKEIIKKKVLSVKDILSDHDFIILVSEFYESLKPLQKRAFERERSGMTAEQFRIYMTPILKRKHIKNLKNQKM